MRVLDFVWPTLGLGRINFETTVMVMGLARLLGEMSAETKVSKVQQLVCSHASRVSARILWSIPQLSQPHRSTFQALCLPNYTRNQTLNTRVVFSLTYPTMYPLIRLRRPLIEKKFDQHFKIISLAEPSWIERGCCNHAARSMNNIKGELKYAGW